MRRLRLRTLLILLVLVTTVPIALFAAWLISRTWSQQETLIDRQNVEQARAIIVAVDQEVEDVIASLNVLALLEPIDAPDKTRFMEIAGHVLPTHRNWESIRLVDSSLHVVAFTTAGAVAAFTTAGAVAASTTAGAVAASTTAGAVAGSTMAAAATDALLAQPDWAKQVIDTGAPAMSHVLQEPVSKRWMVAIGVPVVRGGAVRYVLSARLYATAFSQILQQQHVAPGGVIALVDSDPRIIARTLNEDRFVGTTPSAEFLERWRQSPEGSWHARTLEGTLAYSAYSRSGLTQWTAGVGVPAEPIAGPVRRSFTALVAAALAMCAAALVLAVILGRDIVRGQTAAAAAARGLARGERPAFPESRIVETYDLAEGLRETGAMLAALLEREKAARRTAEALNRTKDEFIATVSHELRTPLNAIFGWVSLLRMGTLDETRQAHALDVIERNTRAQAQLVEDLLDMSRIVQGNVRLGMEPLDLAAVLDAAAESLRPTADARRIALSCDAPRGSVIVSGDASRLQQVVWNILSNALKFTPPGGRIEAGVSAEGADAIVRVADSGEGITPEFLPHVFDRFRQENSAVTRTHSGLGLGLSLVRHLVELHGGTIAAASGGKGTGATFTVRLPLLGAAVKPALAAPPLPDVNMIRGRRILIVDDDADTRELAAQALSDAGVRVVTAASGADALEMLAVEPADAIVADIGMPEMSGYDLVRRLRAEPRLAAIPSVALTAYGGAEARDAALSAGFSAYVRKPYDPRALVALLSGLVASSTDSII